MKINLREVELWLQVTFNPKFWVSRKVNKTWDRAVRAALAAGHVPTMIDSTKLMLNGTQLWGANYPYAYGGTYTCITNNKYKPLEHIVPTRRTRLLMRRIEKEATRMYKEELVNELSSELILGKEPVPVDDDGERTKAEYRSHVNTLTANKLNQSILNTLGKTKAQYIDELQQQYEMLKHQNAVMKNQPYPPKKESDWP